MNYSPLARKWARSPAMRSHRDRVTQATAPSSERNSATERAAMPGRRSRAIRARSAPGPSPDDDGIAQAGNDAHAAEAAVLAAVRHQHGHAGAPRAQHGAHDLGDRDQAGIGLV